MPDIRNAAALYIDTADTFAQLSLNHSDYMHHIVSYFAAERMKHVKHYQKEVLLNYRAGGPVWREYPHDAGMAGKTKATTEGSPMEIKEIKRITNYAMSVAGGQGYQPGGRFLVAFNRRGYFSTKSSRANRVGLVSGSGLSNNLLCRCAFSRCRSSMDNAISCNSSFVIVCTRKAVRCSTSYHSAGIFYGCNLRDDSGRFATHCININNVMLLCAFKENADIFRTNFSRNTSDHLSKKAAYTEAIPYKTGIGIGLPLELEAIHDAPASFFLYRRTRTPQQWWAVWNFLREGWFPLTPVRPIPYSPPPARLASWAVGIIPKSEEPFTWLYPHALTLSGALCSA
ncbi:hypothetical protein EC95NR1_03050 [Escherichia coli]|nr:hypothetical protein EC95JB1_03050 [Escherichia coli]ART26778.1 hypothetical protein EC95NR1_03050 [Escherichia coli]EHW06254.1 hypothetical protein ECDEC8B_4710 [Escherichia coli DEC8B]